VNGVAGAPVRVRIDGKLGDSCPLLVTVDLNAEHTMHRQTDAKDPPRSLGNHFFWPANA